MIRALPCAPIDFAELVEVSRRFRRVFLSYGLYNSRILFY
jgi:hypothetical protein